MGLVINENILAIDLLRKDNIDIDLQGDSQDSLKVLVLNLMPNKLDTEYQLLRLLGNSFVDIQVDFLYVRSHKPKNTNLNYLERAYKTLEQIKNTNYDGMIMTGAPLEFVDFDDISYWNELKLIMDYSNKYVKSTIYLCWAAVAGLYYNYKIPKHIIDKKVVGIFSHEIIGRNSLLFKGLEQEIISPHSRYFEIREEDIRDIRELEVLSKSNDVGIYILAEREGKAIYITGHPEYNTDTLENEYKRDRNKGLAPDLPRNYFPNDDFSLVPRNTWRNHSQILMDNWIRYCLV
ncbi:homoserine O-succinyltransferase [Tissierella sp. MB52-C2]|uniref:homoserine O-acetyltransferase/O-succinyltransferase family protein n=1 Tax=Tissierella sp. MB52-C2 TaxID=3070999 RepID=UPI00280AFC05|nr:homoserine O-succinyltransferase [Tissierella sp. MB52-C2]WMM24949.1 homoserine O-succinyltransferase [Tissierella sp. MB52-C2]